METDDISKYSTKITPYLRNYLINSLFNQQLTLSQPIPTSLLTQRERESMGGKRCCEDSENCRSWERGFDNGGGVQLAAMAEWVEGLQGEK